MRTMLQGWIHCAAMRSAPGLAGVEHDRWLWSRNIAIRPNAEQGWAATASGLVISCRRLNVPNVQAGARIHPACWRRV